MFSFLALIVSNQKHPWIGDHEITVLYYILYNCGSCSCQENFRSKTIFLDYSSLGIYVYDS